VTARQCSALASLTDADAEAGLPLADYPGLTPRALQERLVCCDGSLSMAATSQGKPPHCCRVDAPAACGAHWTPRGPGGTCQLTAKARARHYPPRAGPAPPVRKRTGAGGGRVAAAVAIALALLAALVVAWRWRASRALRSHRLGRTVLIGRLEAIRAP
jgi:hypothetical protein